ncbi:hypothetical protein ACOSQ2_004612 [Xanthoceras sorbifolium]
MAKYRKQHQWAPNLNGTIKLRNINVFGNKHKAIHAVKGYAIHEGFTLIKIKNDSYRYTVTCKNESFDWKLYASCLPDDITSMIKSVRDNHYLCLRVAENKEANARWVTSVLQSTIHSNPTIAI